MQNPLHNEVDKPKNAKGEEEMGVWGQTCVVCHSELSVTLEKHHVIPLSEGGGPDLWNVVSLCRNCHRLVHEWEKVEKTSRRQRTKQAVIDKLRRERKDNLISVILGSFICDRCGALKTGLYHEVQVVSYLTEGSRWGKDRVLCPQCHQALEEFFESRN